MLYEYEYRRDFRGRVFNAGFIIEKVRPNQVQDRFRRFDLTARRHRGVPDSTGAEKKQTDRPKGEALSGVNVFHGSVRFCKQW